MLVVRGIPASKYRGIFSTVDALAFEANFKKYYCILATTAVHAATCFFC